MKTVAECQSKDGKVLEKKEYTENNPLPNAQPPYSRVATVDREGSIEVEDSAGNHQVLGASKPMTKEQQEEFNKNMRRMDVQMRTQNENFSRQMDEFNRNMQESMNNMQKQMAQTFGGNFPFGNSNPFGGSFPFGNFNPFTQLPTHDPFANFHTFFYPPTNNFNGFVSGTYGYTPNTFVDYDYKEPESLESQYAAEEFNPVYNNYRPSVSSTPNRFDKYQRAY